MEIDLKSLKMIELGLEIFCGILILGMCYELMPPLILMGIIITVGGLITCIIYLNNKDKEAGISERFKKWP